jgi:hypothetical protein
VKRGSAEIELIGNLLMKIFSFNEKIINSNLKRRCCNGKENSKTAAGSGMQD